MSEGKYNSAAQTAADGGTMELQIDANGNLKVVAGAAGTLPTGAATSAKQDTAQTSLTAMAAVEGTTAGTAVIADANGTIQQYLRGLIVNGLLGNTSLASILTSVDGLEGVLGTTAGAAVITDANGTAQQYLRGMIVLTLLQNTYLDGVEGSLTTLAGTLPMTSANFLANLRSTMAAPSSVNSGTSSVTLLTSNANRKGATITNTDANALYVLLSGGTASSTNYHALVASAGYYEVPFGVTGTITGIWAADGSGVALVGEAS